MRKLQRNKENDPTVQAFLSKCTKSYGWPTLLNELLYAIMVHDQKKKS